MSVGSDDTLWGIPDCFAGLSDDEDVDDTVQIVSHDPAANSSTVLEPLTAENVEPQFPWFQWQEFKPFRFNLKGVIDIDD